MRHLQPLAPLAVIATLVVTASGAAHAVDARALGLGGSVIADGEGAPGALANPAALMAMQRRGERYHFAFGMSVETRDDAGLIDIADDEANRTLEDDIERAVEEIDLSDVTCVPFEDSTRDSICLDGLDTLSTLSARALDILDSVDGENFSAQVDTGVGLAFTGTPYPFALHLTARGTGRGKLTATDADRTYFEEFENVLADGELTRGEIEDTAALSIDTEGRTVDVVRPEEVLASDLEGGTLARVTLGASIATTLDIGGFAVDVGVTPKLSSIVAYGVNSTLADEFEEGQSSSERLDDSEVEDSSFTFDVGGSLMLSRVPIRVAAVLRNVVPESTETREGVLFETDPQLVIGGAFERDAYTLNADLALNEADIDSFPTQVFAFGAEHARGAFALRGGLNHDFARSEAATGLSLGLGLGPLEIGARLAGIEHAQAGLQLSLSF